jgi:hypothetical protein
MSLASGAVALGSADPFEYPGPVGPAVIDIHSGLPGTLVGVPALGAGTLEESHKVTPVDRVKTPYSPIAYPYKIIHKVLYVKKKILLYLE